MVIQGGSGFFVRDEQGNRYLGGGVWCMTEHMLEGVDLAPIFGANAGADEESNVRQENQCPGRRTGVRLQMPFIVRLDMRMSVRIQENTHRPRKSKSSRGRIRPDCRSSSSTCGASRQRR